MIAGEQIQMLFDEAPVKLFLSAKEGGAVIQWPWRMNGVHAAKQPMVDAADYFILDSSFKHEEIGMEEVIEAALELGADMVALVDIEGSRSETVDSILRSREMVDDSDFDGDVLAPLQPPHGECYKEVEGNADWYGVGGVSRVPPEAKIEAAENVREVSGYDIHLHGLGWGITDPVARRIREQPDLVNSVDSNGAYETAMNNHIDETWKSKRQIPGSGSGRGSVISTFASAYLIERLRRMNPELTIDPAESTSSSASEADW